MDNINNNNNKVKDMAIQDNQREIVVEMFERKGIALVLNDMIEILRDKYIQPGRIIRDAIQENLLFVDAIEDDGTVYLALSDWGEELWEKQHE